MATAAFRDLSSLRMTASTSRVLNLALLGERHAADEEHRNAPLLKNKALNSAIILKHRVRSNETYAFAEPKINTTKVIIPFDLKNLRLGGQAFFVGQINQEQMLRQATGIAETDLANDLNILSLIDSLPSLDPFLLREQLRRAGIAPAASYFDISPADLARMLAFVAADMRQLVAMAFKMEDGAGDPAGRLAEALLSAQLDERLEPLRVTLRLEGDAFREGVFCWKGFLYYKWMRGGLQADIERVSREIGKLVIVGPRDPGSMAYIGGAQAKIRAGLIAELHQASALIIDYDRMFEGLVKNSQANAFRDFLLSAPARFLKLGERIGNISHIASFWRFRFPEENKLFVTLPEALDILRDCESSLSFDQPVASSAA